MKEVFKKDTFWYNITYKVKKGEVSFKKVFWYGLLLKLISGTIASNLQIEFISYLDIGVAFAWMQSMWYSRKNVYHPMWFYLGFSLPVVLTVGFFLGWFN